VLREKILLVLWNLVFGLFALLLILSLLWSPWFLVGIPLVLGLIGWRGRHEHRSDLVMLDRRRTDARL
jgi:fatty acid desaturase